MESIVRLQACFGRTDWDLFKTASAIDGCTDVALNYIRFCEELCVPNKVVMRYPKQKPWFDRFIPKKLWDREAVFRLSDADAFRKARYDVRKSIKRVKREYRTKFEVDISSSNSRELWQGLNKITIHKPKSKSVTGDLSLPKTS